MYIEQTSAGDYIPSMNEDDYLSSDILHYSLDEPHKPQR